MVCVESSGKYVTHAEYQSLLLKELTKDLKYDIKYVDEENKSRFKQFSEKYKNKYVKHYTKKRNNKFEAFTSGELSRMMIEHFDSGGARFN